MITSKFIKIFLTIFPVLCFADEKCEKIDNHALSCPKSAEKSLESLAKYLTEPFEKNEEKIRAIFTWVTHNIDYDIEGFFSGHYGDLSPDGVLQNRRAVCDGYAGQNV